MSKLHNQKMPTLAQLRELFDYRDGVLYHKVNRGKGRRGAPAGCISGGEGYTRLYSSVKGRHHPVHRLVWLWHYGNIPADMEVNHINGDRTDNRIGNLRLAKHADSCRHSSMSKNNTSGFKGVTFYKRDKRWRAQITVNYHNQCLGIFDTKEQAHAAYCAAAEKHFGEFANFGTPRQYIRPPRKETPQSSGQMTQGAGTTGRDSDTMAQGAHEANHSVALTDEVPTVQATTHSAHRAAKRLTAVVDAATGTRYCKRCSGHRKSDGGTYLADALNRRYWVCEPCTQTYHAQRASGLTDGIVSVAGRVAP